MVTGGSVVALKYADGILIATDTLASYGSLARFEGVTRMSVVGAANDTLLAAGGDYSDYQQILKIIDARATTEYTADDGSTMTASMLHHWLTRMMYQRRSKMDPLWNSIVIASNRNGKPYLGTTDLYGTMYEDDFIATGLGAHLALPLLRKGWRADLTEAEATTLLTDSMRVLFYRDTRAGSHISIGKATATACEVTPSVKLETYWEYKEFVRGGGYLGDGSW